jgi:hypothetical protein
MMHSLNFHDFNKYSLKKDFIMNILNNIPIIKKDKQILKKETKKYEEQINDIFFYPDNHFNDSLFWCYHIFTNGFKDYEYSKTNSYMVEKTHKISLLETLKKHKIILKENKIKLTILENELIQQEKIGLYSFNALLLINKINIVFVDNMIYYENLSYGENKICFIKKKKDKYGIWLENTNPSIFDLKKNLIVIDEINKPLKAISNYKISELREISNKLKIPTKNPETAKKYTKKELYMFLKEKLI